MAASRRPDGRPRAGGLFRRIDCRADCGQYPRRARRQWTQNVLTVAKVLGLAVIVAVGFSHPALPRRPRRPRRRLVSRLPPSAWRWFSYCSPTADGRDGLRQCRGEGTAKEYSSRAADRTLAVTVIYVLANLAFVCALGLEGSRQPTVATDVLTLGIGPWAGRAISVLICISALGRHQRANLHRLKSVLCDGQRPPALRLAWSLECPPRHAVCSAADPRCELRRRWQYGSA